MDRELENHLTDISSATARIDERTEHMQVRLDELQETNRAQDEKINDLEDRVNRHGMVLGCVTFGTMTVITAVADRFTKYFPL